MSYEENDPRLTAYALDEADAEERAKIDEELLSDPELRDVINELRNASKSITEALGAEKLEGDELLDAQRVRIDSRTSRVSAPKRRWIRRRFAYGSIAAAAALLLTAILLAEYIERSALEWNAVAKIWSPEFGRRLAAGLEEPLRPAPASVPEAGQVAPASNTNMQQGELADLQANSNMSISNRDGLTAETEALEAKAGTWDAYFENSKLHGGPANFADGNELMFKLRTDSNTGGAADVPAGRPALQAENVDRLTSETRESLRNMGYVKEGIQVERGRSWAWRDVDGDGIGDHHVRLSVVEPGFRDLIGPNFDLNNESYAPISENAFTQVSQEPLSTFGLDVDTASYANSRRFLNSGQLPPPNAVRIEEFVNAFKYEYAAPSDDRPIALRGEIASCPWNPEHRLARIAVKAKDIPFESQPPLRLTFLIDVSGSMEDNNKLPLLRESMKTLVARLRPTDQVAIVTYRDTAQRELSPTPASNSQNICAAIDALRAEGSTNGAGGIELAYAAAKEQYLGGGLNRVILATDGDFNVGETENNALIQRITEHAKSGVFLTVLGFGIDNLQDDRLEGLADKGNGNYFYIDSFAEANKVLVERMAGTIAVAAKDVKIQVEFNPAKIGAYRLLGYENRALAAQDFNDDRKDAGDLGAGHTVTALYELVPVGVSVGAPGVDDLKYQRVPSAPPTTNDNPEAMTVKLRYKKPDASESERIELPLSDMDLQFDNAPSDFRFATATAAFAMLLRNSQHAGSATLDMVQQIAEKSGSNSAERGEFLSLVVAAKTLGGDRAPSGKGAIGVRLDNIIKWRDGEYRAEITTDASGKANLYKEGEVFENYKLMSIDPLNKLVTIYSSQHDKVFELRLW